MPVSSNENKAPLIDEEFAALSNNIAAVLAVSSSVERTLGPKGLDTMLVDRFGEILVTNSGVTILEKIDVSHPAAQMLVNVAKAQHKEVGDGTTTATIMAGAILQEGINQVSRGVPVSRLLEGIQQATQLAVEIFQQEIARTVTPQDDSILLEVACTAGRGDREAAKLLIQAAKMMGEEKLKEPSFKLADLIVAREGIQDALIQGVVLDKSRIDPLMSREIRSAKILLLEDDLQPEKIEEGALHSESGFRKSMELKSQFLENLQKVLSLGAAVILAQGGIHREALEILSHSGIFTVRRLTRRQLEEAARHTGAKPVKCSGLNRNPEAIESCLGYASRVREDEKMKLIFITGGKGKPHATLLIGAATKQVTDEKERKARDAASSLQAALQSGVVPGGGAAELAVVRQLELRRNQFKAMASYGLDCVLEGLRKPFLQMAANAGYNPLEKAEEIFNAQARQKKNSISLHFETGKPADMEEEKIYDPLAVKVHALLSASEVAQAILRINRIIKMRENGKEDRARRT